MTVGHVSAQFEHGTEGLLHLFAQEMAVIASAELVEVRQDDV
jgi:hypothetical protein